MKTSFIFALNKRSLDASQRGVALMMALIMLVAMSMAGLALMRSVDTSLLISGNLAFKQSSIAAGDAGTEAATVWLQNNNAGGALYQAVSSLPAYQPARGADPASGTSWDAYWSTIETNATTLPVDTSTGNEVSYVIHRLCNTAGDPAVPGTGCTRSPTGGSTSGSSKGAGRQKLQFNAAVYYRITSRIVGPRNTVSYTQAIVTM
jgi:type IV pilus assembly protein PilX